MDNKLKTVDAETLLSTPMSKTMFIVRSNSFVRTGAARLLFCWRRCPIENNRTGKSEGRRG